jgi:hypothetical protein
MLRLRAVTDRQALIEEIYTELEAILLKKGEGSDDEEDARIIAFPSSPGGTSLDSESSELARKRGKQDSLSELLAELERTQKLLKRGLSRLSRIVDSNS